jgi:hypothetical protein
MEFNEITGRVTKECLAAGPNPDLIAHFDAVVPKLADRCA